MAALGDDEQYWNDLVQCGYSPEEGPFVARLERLGRLNILYLFNELIKIKASILSNGTTNKSQMEELALKMHHYVDAVRDYQYLSQLESLPGITAARQRVELETLFARYMQQPGTGNTSQPYDNDYLSLRGGKFSQTSDAIREFLRKWLPPFLSWTAQEKANRRADYMQGRVPEMYSKALDRIARFIVGLVGGLSLIVPLLIMAFHSSLTKTLVTVCIAVVTFALAVSLKFQVDVAITATATYAAVLVVFVGTSVASRDGG